MSMSTDSHCMGLKQHLLSKFQVSTLESLVENLQFEGPNGRCSLKAEVTFIVWMSGRDHLSRWEACLVTQTLNDHSCLPSQIIMNRNIFRFQIVYPSSQFWCLVGIYGCHHFQATCSLVLVFNADSDSSLMLVFMHSSPCVCLGWVQYFSMGMILGSQSKASRFSWEMSQGMPSTIALNCIL